MKLENRQPIALEEANIKRAETLYTAKYLGPWCIKNAKGCWTNFAVDVFYTDKPSKPDYSHYFGCYRDFITDNLMVCDAASFNSAPITGMLIDGVLYSSRFRHDYVDVNGEFLDGGRDYIHTNSSNLVLFNFVDGEICIQ